MCNASMASFMMPKGGLCYAGQLAQATQSARSTKNVKKPHTWYDNI